MNYTETVAANIRASMARGGYRIADLAKVIGKLPAAAGQKYRGKTQITIDELGAIAEWLDVPAGDFFD